MVLEMNPEWEVARFKDHLSIGATYGTWPNLSAVEYGLFVSGSSVFYSGGTNNSDPVSIYSYGTISGATDLYIDGNMYSQGQLIY